MTGKRLATGQADEIPFWRSGFDVRTWEYVYRKIAELTEHHLTHASNGHMDLPVDGSLPSHCFLVTSTCVQGKRPDFSGSGVESCCATIYIHLFTTILLLFLNLFKKHVLQPQIAEFHWCFHVAFFTQHSTARGLRCLRIDGLTEAQARAEKARRRREERRPFWMRSSEDGPLFRIRLQLLGSFLGFCLGFGEVGLDCTSPSRGQES